VSRRRISTIVTAVVAGGGASFITPDLREAFAGAAVKVLHLFGHVIDFATGWLP
jgi:hypothetical protein